METSITPFRVYNIVHPDGFRLAKLNYANEKELYFQESNDGGYLTPSEGLAVATYETGVEEGIHYSTLVDKLTDKKTEQCVELFLVVVHPNNTIGGLDDYAANVSVGSEGTFTWIETSDTIWSDHSFANSFIEEFKKRRCWEFKDISKALPPFQLN
ncbi:hypothetical protein [Endozoicomonas sp. ONNA1]|uniref:hypothetical protein n=1 Tax=Endozoicomonas sp. ONNA1 TaxID=2828740 RepID=UPI002147A75F|nr:hypothetical protein [Endozoicomonas sp. ONNA1]